jgi:hypothetical protein
MNKLAIKVIFPTKIIYLFIISFTICLTFAFDSENKNLLLIGVMGLAPLILLRFVRLESEDILLLLFIVSIILFPLILHTGSTRWSTVIYTCMFCVSFIAYKQLLRYSGFTALNFLKLLKYLIFAYFIVLVIQQIGVLTGLPILNERFYIQEEPWKLNALGAEPSWSGRIIGLLMYCYITMRSLLLGRKYNLRNDFRFDKWLWFAFLYSMVTLGSATAIFFIVIILIQFIRFRNLALFIAIIVLISFFFNISKSVPVDRFLKTVSATITLSEKSIVEADHSASFRIVPIIVLAKKIKITTLDDWFGYGVDYVKNNIDLKVPGSKDLSAGGFFVLFIEYGFISFFLFTIFTLYTTLNKKDITGSSLFWFILVFVYGLNVQIPWLAMMLLYTNKYFQNKFHFNNMVYETEKKLH